jgi:hypothetical protein
MEHSKQKRFKAAALQDLRTPARQQRTDVKRNPRISDVVASLFPGVSSPAKVRTESDNFSYVETTRSSMMKAATTTGKGGSEYTTRYEQIRASIKGIQNELELIDKRRDIVEEFEVERLNGRAKLDDLIGGRVESKLTELAGQEVGFWMDIRDISHDQWQKAIDFEQCLVQERGRYHKELTDVKNTSMKRLERFKEKTYVLIKGLEAEVARQRSQVFRQDTELRMQLNDYESQRINQEYREEQAMLNDADLTDVKDLPSAIKKIGAINAARRVLAKKLEESQETSKLQRKEIEKLKHKLKGGKYEVKELIDKISLLHRGLEELLPKSKLAPTAQETISEHLKAVQYKQAVMCVIESPETESKDFPIKKSGSRGSSRKSKKSVKDSSLKESVRPPPPAIIVPSMLDPTEGELSSPITDRSHVEDMRLTLTLSTTPLDFSHFKELQSIVASFLEKGIAEASMSLVEPVSLHDLTIAELLQLVVQLPNTRVSVKDLIKDALAKLVIIKKPVTPANKPIERRKTLPRRPTLQPFILRDPLQVQIAENAPEDKLNMWSNLRVQSFVSNDSSRLIGNQDFSTTISNAVTSASNQAIIVQPDLPQQAEAIYHAETAFLTEPLADDDATLLNEPGKSSVHDKVYVREEVRPVSHKVPLRVKEQLHKDASFLRDYLPKAAEPEEMSMANRSRWEKLLCSLYTKHAKDLGRRRSISGHELEIWDVMSLNVKYVAHRLKKFRSVPTNIEVGSAVNPGEFHLPDTFISSLRHKQFVISPLNASQQRRTNSMLHTVKTNQRTLNSKRSNSSLSQELTSYLSNRDDTWSTPKQIRGFMM